MPYFCNPKTGDSLAQQVEHNTFNVGVLGSSPRRITEEPSEMKALLFSGVWISFMCLEFFLGNFLFPGTFRGVSMLGMTLFVHLGHVSGSFCAQTVTFLVSGHV